MKNFIHPFILFLFVSNCYGQAPVLPAWHGTLNISQSQCFNKAYDAMKESGLSDIQTQDGWMTMASNNHLRAAIYCNSCNGSTTVNISVAGNRSYARQADQMRDRLKTYMLGSSNDTAGGKKDDNTDSNRNDLNDCSKIKWSISASGNSTSIANGGNKVGDELCFECLPRVTSYVRLFGSDEYEHSSSICYAAKHAGIIDDTGGKVTIKFTPLMTNYSSSEKNGVTSSEWKNKSSGLSFVVIENGTSDQSDGNLANGSTRVWLDKDRYTYGEPINVHFDGLKGSTSDWIAITKASKATNTYDTYKYSGGKTFGTLKFDYIKPGKYEARVYFNNSYKLEAKVPFTVQDHESSDQILPPDNPYIQLPPPTCNIDSWKLDYGEMSFSDGAILATPAADGYTSYFKAPQDFDGIWTGYKYLNFEKKSWGGSYYGPTTYGAYGDIVIKNGNKTARYDIGKDHSGKWQSYQIELSGGSWKLSGGATSLKEVLSNVTEFKIRAEYGGGTDYSGLRNILLSK